MITGKFVPNPSTSGDDTAIDDDVNRVPSPTFSLYLAIPDVSCSDDGVMTGKFDSNGSLVGVRGACDVGLMLMTFVDLDDGN